MIPGRFNIVLIVPVLFLLLACAGDNAGAGQNDLLAQTPTAGHPDGKSSRSVASGGSSNRTPAEYGSENEYGSEDEEKQGDEQLEDPSEETEEITEEAEVADPLEPINRIMFTFNDRLYFWGLKPFSKVYNAVLHEDIRVSIRNFFSNLAMPVRFVSCLLQLRFECSGIELARFVINSTVGVAGLFDVASKGDIKLKQQDSDTGLMLGHYGIGEGIYIVWPFLGPSSLRDTAGLVGDSFLNPVNYITPVQDAIGVEAFDYANKASLRIGDYEDLKKAAIDPYTALKDAYTENRRARIK